MHKQQLLQESELANGNIGTSRCLKTFHTSNTHTNMSGLNHGDIIRAIADCEQDRLEMSLDELDDKCFL